MIATVLAHGVNETGNHRPEGNGLMPVAGLVQQN
jgi:hypothetical protein